MALDALSMLLTITVLMASCAGVGAGLLALTGRSEDGWTGPALGLAALLTTAPLLIRLPGGALTTGLVVAVAALAGGIHALRAGRRGLVLSLAVCGAVAAWLTIPFLVSGRFGLLGQTVNDDTRFHLWAAEYLSHGLAVPDSVLSGGWYPLGPHAIAGALAGCLGVGADVGLVAVLVVGPLVTALAAVGAVATSSPLRRWVTGVAVGIPYLIVAYYGQAAFKETLLAALVTAYAVRLRAEERTRRLDARGGALLGILVAGGLATYTYPALLWFVAVGVAVAAATVLAGMPRPDLGRREVRGALAAVAVAALVVVVAAAPSLPSLVRSYDVLSVSPSSTGAIGTANIGNLLSELSLFAAFAQWPTDDFRLQPDGAGRNLMPLFGVAVAAWAGLWWLRRRDAALPAAAAVATIIFLGVRERESAYVAAKALVIAAPLITLMSVGALVSADPKRRLTRVAQLAVTAAFVGGLAYSGYLSLRTAQVAPAEHTEELESLRPIVRDRRVLYLANDNFAGARLYGAEVTAPPVQAPVPFELRPEKPYTLGQALDFDSVTDATLDRFDFVLTSRARFGSAPPPNFRLERRTPSFDLWRRTGPTGRRHVLAGEGALPARRLACTRAADRALTRRGGLARVVGAPTVVPGPPGGGVGAGHELELSFRAPPGRHAVSLQYQSPQPVTLTAPGYRAVLPPNLDGMGPYWPAGEITVPRGGEVDLTIGVHRASPLFSRSQFSLIPALALSDPRPPETVPLARACGRWVDSYETSRLSRSAGRSTSRQESSAST